MHEIHEVGERGWRLSVAAAPRTPATSCLPSAIKPKPNPPIKLATRCESSTSTSTSTSTIFIPQPICHQPPTTLSPTSPFVNFEYFVVQPTRAIPKKPSRPSRLRGKTPTRHPPRHQPASPRITLHCGVKSCSFDIRQKRDTLGPRRK